MGVDDHLIRICKALYAHPEFHTEVDGHQPNIYSQQSGIRHGCPLSPYILLIVRSSMFKDVEQYSGNEMEGTSIGTSTFNQVLFEHDTICVTNSIQAITKYLHAIGFIGEQYGLKLNKNSV